MGFYSKGGGFIGASYATDNRGVFDIVSHQLDVPSAASSIDYVTDGLTHNLDAGDASSYGGSGTTWTDLAGNGNFTLSGSPTHVSSSPGHFDFDGSNDYAYGPAFTVNSGAYSIEVWFRTTAGDGELLISSHNTTSSTPSGYTRMIWVGTDDELWFGQWESGQRTVNDTVTITDGNWHQAVGVFDGDMYFYRDGNQVGSNTSANGTSDSGTKYWNIGGCRNSGWPSASSNYNHRIDADIAIVRIYWGKGLTSSEVTQNFNAVKGRFGL